MLLFFVVVVVGVMVVMVVVLYYSRHFISWVTWTKKYLISTEGLT